MSLVSDILAFFLAAVTAAVSPTASMERRVERTFQVTPGSVVLIDLSGGSISVATGTGRHATIRLIQRVEASTESAADAALQDYNISFVQRGPEVSVIARRKVQWQGWQSNRVRIDAELTVPADVSLNLDTSGGSITVRGEREADVVADTSGGGIHVDGGRGTLSLDTSGGGITVGRTLGVLHADTSGGGIAVDRVGATASDVTLDTSGGGIRVGVEPGARLHIDASTSGGSVSIDGLPLATSSSSRTHVIGTLNGGGGHLRAATSGGGVRISAVPGR